MDFYLPKSMENSLPLTVLTSDHLLVESPPIYWRYYTTKRTSYIPRFRIFSETFL